MMKQTTIYRFITRTGTRYIATAVALVSVMLLSTLPATAATNASMSLSPSAGAYTTGNTVTVTVVVNSGGSSVNAVQANFSYPSSLLQFKSFDYGTSAFGIQAESSASGGSVRMARGALTAVNGTSLVVGKVSFTALAAGTATLSIAGDSTVVSSSTNENILGAKNGASYTLSAPAPPPPPPSGGTTTPTTTKPTTTTSKPTTTSPTPTTTTSSTGDTPSAIVPSDTDTQEQTTQTSENAPAATDTGGVAEAGTEGFNWRPVSYVGAALLTVILLSVGAWWLLSHRGGTRHTFMTSSDNVFTPPPEAPHQVSAPQTPPQAPPAGSPPAATGDAPQIIAPTDSAEKPEKKL